MPTQNQQKSTAAFFGSLKQIKACSYIPLQQWLYDSGEKKKNNKSVFLPTSEMHIHILQGWCKAYQRSNKGLQESQDKVTPEKALLQGYASTY